MSETQPAGAPARDEGGPPEPPLGRVIRRRRRSLDLTLAAVARRTGLSVPFLSQVENARARPSMRSLQRIADGLETTAVDLLATAEAGERPVDLVRAEDDAGLARDAGARFLVRGRRQLHALEFTGGGHRADREFRHPNDELMYVVEGAAEVWADGEVHELRSGDTLYLAGGVRHRWRSAAPDTRLLLVAVSDHVTGEARQET
ncbi:helix-turn-helix domain-containing protein [Streptacidiphilus neutrinimicus]|uniref:helix-turn-helix domain-containing protein n=1 Tax=Streptacidiphilus neutrinimicus TaxID=105420 RepID=UPI000A02141B|nr:cupin domain-containing protein [Streptacidiphilus neutrinimicus]